MQGDEQGRHEGSWWVASAPEVRLNGFLELGNKHELTVFGSFTPEDVQDSDSRLEVIHGICGGRFFTLVDCSIRFDSAVFDGFDTSAYYAPVVLQGHVDHTFEGASFDLVEVELGRMVNFTARSGLRREYTDTTESLHHEMPSSLQAEYDGVKYELHFGLAQKGGFGRVEYREHALLMMDLPRNVSIREVMDEFVSPFLDLLNLASGYPSSVDALRVARSGDSTDGLSRWSSLTIYRGIADLAEEKEVRPQQYLVTLNDIPFADLVPRWLSLVGTLGLALDLLFSLDRPQAGFVSSRFFNAAASAEGVHRRLNPEREQPSERHQKKVARIINRASNGRDRRWLTRILRYSHRLDFATRLAELLNEADDCFAPYIAEEQRESWIKIVTRLRNISAHSLDDDNLERRPQALHRLGSSINLLLRVILLLRLGVPRDVLCRRLQYHFQWSYLPKGLSSDVPELFTA